MDNPPAGRLQAILDQAVNSLAVPGMQGYVQSADKRTWSGASGTIDLARRFPMRRDHILRVGSTTKTFWAVVILRLVEEKKIELSPALSKVVYHDPCELGRGCGIYDEPRELLSKMADLVPAGNEREFSMCCGGSLGSTGISSSRRDEVTLLALESLLSQNPDTIVTACPLCKKTFQKDSPVEVKDLGEMVASSLLHQKEITRVTHKERILTQ